MKKKILLIIGVILTLSMLFRGIPALADSLSVNFESPTYSTGSINGQDGWSSTGPYDQSVVSSPVIVGAQSFRISNAVTSGSFGDQTFSKSLVNEAGETTAQASAYSGGTRQGHFETQFDIKSTTSSQQTGLAISVSPDRGDGARMSYLRFDDLADGIHVMFDDYKDAAPVGTLATPALGCGAEDDFAESDIATVNRTSAHTIKLTVDLVDGPNNDVVNVYVDGVLKHTGGSWEDYFRWCTESGGGVPNDSNADVSRTVDSLLIRAGGTAVPANSGNGYLFDNLSLTSSTPTAPTVPTITHPANGSTVTVSQMDKVDWTDSTGATAPILYQYQAYSDAGYTSQIYDSGMTLTSSEIPTPGTPPGTYYLRVRAQGSTGPASDWSNGSDNIYKVTVVPDPINAFDVPAQCDQTIAYNHIVGKNKAETINGTPGNDLIEGKGGADKINGLGGNDCIVGASGADTLSGGDGNDVLIGADGADTLNGGADNDKLYGMGGADTMNGDSGNDTLDGGGAADRAIGGTGTDTCTAESKNSCEL